MEGVGGAIGRGTAHRHAGAGRTFEGGAGKQE